MGRHLLCRVESASSRGRMNWGVLDKLQYLGVWSLALILLCLLREDTIPSWASVSFSV